MLILAIKDVGFVGWASAFYDPASFGAINIAGFYKTLKLKMCFDEWSTKVVALLECFTTLPRTKQ